MKVIVAGMRDFTDEAVVKEAIANSGFEITEHVNGGAAGVDAIALNWAVENKIPVKIFPADWKQYGLAAGPIRNRQMAEYAEALVAVWDGESKGTKNMIETATKLGLKVFIEFTKPNENP